MPRPPKPTQWWKDFPNAFRKERKKWHSFDGYAPPGVGLLGARTGMTVFQERELPRVMRWAVDNFPTSVFRYYNTDFCREAAYTAQRMGAAGIKVVVRDQMRTLASCGVVIIAPPPIDDPKLDSARRMMYQAHRHRCLRGTHPKMHTARGRKVVATVYRPPHIGVVLKPQGGVVWCRLWRPGMMPPHAVFHNEPAKLPDLLWHEFPVPKEDAEYSVRPRWVSIPPRKAVEVPDAASPDRSRLDFAFVEQPEKLPVVRKCRERKYPRNRVP